MKIKTTLAVIALSLAPGLAFAAGCSERAKMDVTASSCVTGTVWDEASKACVTPTSS
jgi:outer membrane murein-binding lipoprotein Lpp